MPLPPRNTFDCSSCVPVSKTSALADISQICGANLYHVWRSQTYHIRRRRIYHLPKATRSVPVEMTPKRNGLLMAFTLSSRLSAPKVCAWRDLDPLSRSHLPPNSTPPPGRFSRWWRNTRFLHCTPLRSVPVEMTPKRNE